MLPDDSDLLHIPPSAISTKGIHRVRGKVVVTWNGNNLLLLLANGRLVEANLRTKDAPRIGEAEGIAAERYYYGKGVKKNLKLSRKHAERAARLGDTRGTSILKMLEEKR